MEGTGIAVYVTCIVQCLTSAGQQSTDQRKGSYPLIDSVICMKSRACRSLGTAPSTSSLCLCGPAAESSIRLQHFPVPWHLIPHLCWFCATLEKATWHTGRAAYFESFQLVPRCCELILCPSAILLQIVMSFLQIPELATDHLCRATQLSLITPPPGVAVVPPDASCSRAHMICLPGTHKCSRSAYIAPQHMQQIDDLRMEPESVPYECRGH